MFSMVDDIQFSLPVLGVGGSMSPGGDKFERTPTYSGVFQEEEGGASQTVLETLSPGQREQLARETETLSQEHSRYRLTNPPFHLTPSFSTVCFSFLISQPFVQLVIL